MIGKVAITLTALLTLPVTALAGDRDRQGYHGYRHYDQHSARHVYHHYPRYDYRHRGQRRSDNDDLAWAVGGFILGTVVANQRSARAPEPLAVPPARRRVQVCYDEVAYDRNDDPYVERRCEVDWR